jgi:fumarate reductase subunit D
MEDAEKRFWSDVWPLILKSPVALFAAIATLLMGYAISFMLFDYRTAGRSYSHLLHVGVGAAYACFVLVCTTWGAVISTDHPLTLASLAAACPRTIVLSFALLLVIIVVVTFLRERRRGIA